MQSGLLVQDFAMPLSAGFRKGATQNKQIHLGESATALANVPVRRLPHAWTKPEKPYEI